MSPKKRPSARLAALSLLLALVVPASAAGDAAIPPMGWNPANHAAIMGWLDRIEGTEPQRLLVLSDCDNTVWAGDIGDAALKAAASHGIVSWLNAPIIPEYPYGPPREGDPKPSVFDYYEYLYERNPPLAANYAAMAFAGLPLSATDIAFEAAAEAGALPKAYPEMKALFNHIMGKGIAVGFVSASPIFWVAPMLERAGIAAPLWAVEGIDVYVSDPGDREGKRAVLLSNLIQSEGLKNWDDVLKRHGRMIIQPKTSEVTNMREGKGAAGASIAARRATMWSAERGGKGDLGMSELRLAGVFGDNFAPFSDLAGADPRESGNDHGMLRALPFIEGGGVVVNIYKAAMDGGRMDLARKKPSNDGFLAFVKQAQPLYRGNVFLDQIGIYQGDGMGSFWPAELPRGSRP